MAIYTASSELVGVTKIRFRHISREKAAVLPATSCYLHFGGTISHAALPSRSRVKSITVRGGERKPKLAGDSYIFTAKEEAVLRCRQQSLLESTRSWQGLHSSSRIENIITSEAAMRLSREARRLVRQRRLETVEGLKLQELNAFAPPKVKLARSSPDPQRESESSFPFMKLPYELRQIVYNYHFLQPVEDHRHCDNLHWCPSEERCVFRTFNEGIPVRMLWTVSKAIYQEAMPLYFRTKKFIFTSLTSLIHFLSIIGPYHRQYITNVALETPNDFLCEEDSIRSKAFTLLCKCPALTSLRISFEMCISLVGDYTFQSPTEEELRHALVAIQDLLKLRGIQTLDIVFFDTWLDESRAPRDSLAENLQVLKQPYDAAAVEKRAMEGISPNPIPRENFLGDVIIGKLRCYGTATLEDSVCAFVAISANEVLCKATGTS
ncbi:hypothetical protein MMC28_006420 [Mycoblastus sanguinarius]|nr:hypothetical protein [Mycoblastus sanguinarius]